MVNNFLYVMLKLVMIKLLNAEIEKLDEQSYKMATVGVERLEMGDDAEAAMSMAKSVADSLTEDSGKTSVSKRRSLDLSMWDTPIDIDEVEEEINAQIKRFRSFGVEPSHLDNHMGSLYGIETGRFELLNLTLDIAGEEGLPFRFPGTYVPEMFENDTLEVKIDKDLIAMMYGKILDYAKDQEVALPDFLIPGEWNGPQNDSYENYKEYIYELYKTFPNGITETYIHPALECDELKAISGAWHRRVWEHRLFSDPQTLQHIKACGIQLINYRDLKKMKGF